MSPEEFVMWVLAASVPVAMASIAWRNRGTRPIAARLFIAAAIFQCLPLGIHAIEQLLGVGYLFEIWQAPELNGMDQSLMLGDELRPGNPGWQRMIAWQIFLSGFNMVAWSLMAWAILRRPDDRSPTVIVSS